jgi:hypothetical protein
MAKTYKNLYPQVIDFGNLMDSWHKARRGKRYQTNVAAFQQRLDQELVGLQRELTAETWEPGGYRSFTIHEPKRRKISAAPFRDRVVHHALTVHARSSNRRPTGAPASWGPSPHATHK